MVGRPLPSLVFASNTRQLAIYRHASWGIAQLAATTATFSAGTWYRAGVTLGAAGMVHRPGAQRDAGDRGHGHDGRRAPATRAPTRWNAAG